MRYLIFVYCVIVIAQSNVKPCPDMYVCSWMTDHRGMRILRLYCKPRNKIPIGFEPVSTVIDNTNIPRNTTRIEVTCYAENSNNHGFKGIKVEPRFFNLTSISHVTISNIELINNTLVDLSGLSGLFRHLELKNLDLRTLNMKSIKALHSLDLIDLVDIDDLRTEMAFANVREISRINLRNVGLRKFGIQNWIPLLRQLVNFGRSLTTAKLTRIQRTPLDFNLGTLIMGGRIYNIKHIDISWNMITNIRGNPRYMLPHLEYLNFANNLFNVNNHSIDFLSNVIQHEKLKILDMSNTTSFRRSNTNNLILLSACPINKDPLPTILNFGLSFRSVNLRSSILLEDLAKKMKPVCLMDRNTIRYVDLSESRSSEHLKLALSLRNIDFLSLQNTNLIIDDPYVFHNFRKLKTLLLGNNRLGSVFEDYSDLLLRSNTVMKSLDLSGCQLPTTLPKNLLENLDSLEYLNISSNHNLDNINEIDFSVHKNLRFLNISHTKLGELTFKTLTEFVSLENLTIDLSNNEYLLCTQFLKEWISSTISAIDADDNFLKFLNIENTYCVLEDGSRAYFADLRLLEYTKSNWIMVLIITLGVLIITLLLSVFVWFKFRWKFELFIFKTKKKKVPTATLR